MRLLFAIASLLVLIGTSVAYSRLPGTRETGIFEVDPPTPYFHYLPSGPTRGRVLAVHGLNSNKGLLNTLAHALADGGLEVFAIDLPGHGKSETPFNALRARDAVDHVLEKLGPETFVLGHSLGGALLLDVAGERPIKSMVLFSPAPIPVDEIRAERILLFEGEFDPGRIRAFAPEVQAATQGTVEYHDVPWTGHTGTLFRPYLMEQVTTWLGGDPRANNTHKRLGLLLLMSVAALAMGIILLGKPAKPGRDFSSSASSNGSRTIVTYVAAAAASALLASWIPITAWLHLYATDYLIGYLFLAGSILSLTTGRLPLLRGTVLRGIGSALYVIVVPGLLVVTEFTQITLSDGRWWRFLAIAVLLFPLCWADEILVRSMQSRWKAVAVGFVTRILLTSAAITAVLTIHREAAFLLLMSGFLLIFWVALWVAGEVVHRRTNDPFATAIFLSLIQGWVFAAVFVTT